MIRHIIVMIVLAASCMGAVATDIKHPSLLFTPQRVQAAQRAVKTDTAMVSAWQKILAEADVQLKKGDVYRLEYLALAYQMTGKKEYADKLRQVLATISKVPSWGNAEMLAREPAWRSELQMAHRAFQLAVAYDAVYHDMTPAERHSIADGLYRLAVEPLLGDWLDEPTRIHSLNSMGHNWWTSCVGMGAILGLAIGNEVPQAAESARKAVEALPQWFEFAGDVIQNKPRTFDRQGGGMYESINYASFGITEALLLRQAWLNSHPGAKLEPIPQMNQLVDFFCHVAYPRTGMLYSLNFGDSHKNVTGESSMLLARAQGVDDPNMLWYLEQLEPGQHREGFPRHFPMGFLYSPVGEKAPEIPSLPLSHLWPDFGWATMRDSWQPDGSMLAVKSGATWNHSHADANSFIVFHKGVDIIKDGGNCSYGRPEYRKYFFQSDAHNVVRVDGKGQPTYQQYHGTMLPGSVSGLVDGGNIKYVLADGTGPMSHALNRNFRHFLWIDDVIYIVDDLGSHQPGHFEWLLHPGGKAEKRGFDLHITSGDASVAVRPLYPAPLAPSNYVHDYPENLYWEVYEGPREDLQGNEEYWSFHMPQTADRVKAVTAIMLKDSANQRELPVIERRQGKDWIGLRVTNKGKVTDIYINQLADGRLMHLNSWIEADGWTTDAYMFAVSYPEGSNPAKSPEMFIGHGSSLRRGSDVYFSSLAKLNVIAHSTCSKLDIQSTGQPHMRYGFRSDASSVKANGNPAKVNRQGSMLSFDLE